MEKHWTSLPWEELEFMAQLQHSTQEQGQTREVAFKARAAGD